MRHTDRLRHTWRRTVGQADRQGDRQDKWTDRHREIDRWTGRHRETQRWTGRQTWRQTDGQSDRLGDRQMDRQTDLETDREMDKTDGQVGTGKQTGG